MAVVRNAFVLLNLPLALQTVTIGVVIILAVALDRFRAYAAIAVRRFGPLNIHSTTKGGSIKRRNRFRQCLGSRSLILEQQHHRRNFP